MEWRTAGWVGLSLVLGAANGVGTAHAAAPGARLVVTFDVGGPAEVVAEIEVDDQASRDTPAPVTALTLRLDGQPDPQVVLLLPGSGRDRYQALVGPVSSGRHVLEAVPSELWPSEPRLIVKRLVARPVHPTDSRYDALRLAPRFWVRADTVGDPTDALLLTYVEEDRVEGGRRYRYSAIFSNEDGGTSTRALLARWGRTTDIELAYEVVVGPGGAPVEELFQGADHGMRPFKGRKVGAHPVLLVATLNNVFLDRGRSAALVAPVPRAVAADAGTRESVMDAEPWTFGVAARELAREGKLLPGHGQKREQVVDDLRRYLYVDARLALDGAVAAARVGLADGTSRTSHQGDGRLAIDRDGWVRTAVPLGANGSRVVSLAFDCLPRGDAPGAGSCEIEVTSAFLLDESYRPTPSLVSPARMRLTAGQGHELSLKTSP